MVCVCVYVSMYVCVCSMGVECLSETVFVHGTGALVIEMVHKSFVAGGVKRTKSVPDTHMHSLLCVQWSKDVVLSVSSHTHAHMHTTCIWS